MATYEQLSFFAQLDQVEEESDPCDNCNRPWCYGCPYIEENEQNRKIVKPTEKGFNARRYN